jgi:hypothetical protein
MLNAKCQMPPPRPLKGASDGSLGREPVVNAPLTNEPPKGTTEPCRSDQSSPSGTPRNGVATTYHGLAPVATINRPPSGAHGT